MIQRQKPPLSSTDILALVGISAVVLVLLTGLLLVDIRWSALVGGGGNFYSAWAGAREYLYRGGDPYGISAASQAQLHIRPAPLGMDARPQRLTVPFMLMPFYLPVALIPDPIVARGAWALLSQLTLLAAMFVMLKVLEWQPSKRMLAASLIPIIFSFYAIAAIVDGTAAVFLALVFVAQLWCLKLARDEWAGILAALTVFLWQVGLPFMLLFWWRVAHEHRSRVFGGFLMALVTLLLISLMLFPGWLLPFWVASVAAIREGSGISIGGALLQLGAANGPQVGRALSLFTGFILLLEWAIGRNGDFRRFLWLECIALAVTPLLGFLTEMSNLVAILPTLLMILYVGDQLRPRLGWIGRLILVTAFGMPWALSWGNFGLRAAQVESAVFLILPTAVFLGLYWIRWWFLRPVRTWLDEVRAAGG